VETSSGPFDDKRIYTPNSAAADDRSKSPSGRARYGPEFWRTGHAEGRLRGINRNGRLTFFGSDLNRYLRDLCEVAEPPSERVQARVDARIRHELSLERA